MNGMAQNRGHRYGAHIKHDLESAVRHPANELSEENAPAPLENNAQLKTHLEDVEKRPRQGPDEYADLDAPPPDPANTEYRRTSYLEDTKKGEKSTEQDQFEPSPLLTRLYTISYLIFFAIFGTLARLGVQWLTFYPGAPVTINNLWANFGGSIFMGFLTEDRKLFREEWGSKPQRNSFYHEADGGRGTEEERKAHGKVKKTIPLFVGLATGFCGSFTSFSTFSRDMFHAIANEAPSPSYHMEGLDPGATVPRNGGYDFLALVAVIILTICVSIGGLFFGAHVAVAIDKVTPTLPFRFVRRIMDPIFVVLGIGCWLGAVFMAIWPPDRSDGPAGGSVSRERWRGDAIFAIVFAPLGCLGRWYASAKMNSLVPSFPLGTFSANMFGVALLAACYDLQHTRLSSGIVGGSYIGCQLLQAIEDGFCGALTTISTWVVELTTLRLKHAYIYGGSSVVGGLMIMIVIMGSVKWSMDFRETTCQ